MAYDPVTGIYMDAEGNPCMRAWITYNYNGDMTIEDGNIRSVYGGVLGGDDRQYVKKIDDNYSVEYDFSDAVSESDIGKIIEYTEFKGM